MAKDVALTIDGRGTAVVDLRDFPEPGSFLDVSQQGIPSTSASTRVELGRLCRTLSRGGEKSFHITRLLHSMCKHQCINKTTDTLFC